MNTNNKLPKQNGSISRRLQTMDGNQAAAHVAYAYSETAAIYPITPSSPMAELCDEWAGKGQKNIYGQILEISQLQSEAGAASAVHGALLAGSLAVTFTASQGLLLMLPNLYRIAGELLPGVIHVAARTIATHALSIFGDHSDIYACRQTGTAIFSESSVQEVMDLSPVAHLAALEGRIPFLNFFDGFRTSHELHKIAVWEYADLKEMVNMEALERFRHRSLHPTHGKVYGSAQNPDIFFQAREASNPFYQALPQIVENQLAKINDKLGTSYGLFDYYGAPDAEHVIIAMGSICETIKEYLDSVPTQKFGLIIVHLYRPFSGAHLVQKLPKNVRQITVLDRTKEPGAAGEPLYLDVTAALARQGYAVSCTADVYTDTAQFPLRIFSGRYGLSSKDTTPAQIAAVYANVTKPYFTVGITDDVTHLSLTVPEIPDTAPDNIVSCKFWGLGGDGTVSATKNAIKIIGNHTDMTAQGYFEYDSKKSRGLTISHLRFGKSPIRSAYLIHKADFVACHNQVYLHKYQMAQELKEGGTFLLNYHFRENSGNTRPEKDAAFAEKSTSVKDAVLAGKSTSAINAAFAENVELSMDDGISKDDLLSKSKELSETKYSSMLHELEQYLPDTMKSYLAKHKIRFCVIDAIGIGKEIGLNSKTSTILQAAFFAVSGLLSPEDAKRWMKEAAEKSYGKNGSKILEMNYQAIDRGFTEVYEIQIPEHWRICESNDNASSRNHSALTNTSAPSDSLDNAPLPDRPEMIDFVKNIQQPVTDQRGNDLPVSAFLPYADGYTPPGSTAHERRNIATELPVWKPENCIQCNRCSFVCPHAVIRPAVLDEKELAAAPKSMDSLPMAGLDHHSFAITISQVDCTGCGTCAAVCPGKQGKKALEMIPVNEHEEKYPHKEWQQAFDYCKPLLPNKEAAQKFRTDTLKGSQFLRPLMEFSGACAGCGETPYVKLLTQLFGSRMYIANATGCSSIWGNSAPSCAYTLDAEGHGPAWSNSLFEDAAEFGYGMLMAQDAARKQKNTLHSSAKESSAKENRNIAQNLDSRQDMETPHNLTSPHSTNDSEEQETIQWILGGDGWAYDIGFSGLDHVLASGKNINILVLDTEVYSNTGGQASKATPIGSTAKFATGGKKTRKKDLASIAMTYGNVYVAQIALGADYNQTVKALTEAAAYPGPSLVIAYATCIAHGIRAGLGTSPHEAKKAVDSGYYHLFRFHPGYKAQGKNPFILDSKEPSLDYETFLEGEIRYDALKRYHPEEAELLFQEAAAQANERYQYLKGLETLYAPKQELTP